MSRPNWKPAKGTFKAERQARNASEETLRQKVYRQVDKRDGKRCRYCGTPHLIEHHHIQERSLLGEDSTENVVLLCRKHHSAVQTNKLLIIGRDANKLLRFQWLYGGGLPVRKAS